MKKHILSGIIGSVILLLIVVSTTDLDRATLITIIIIGFIFGVGISFAIDLVIKLSKLKPKDFKDRIMYEKANHFKGLRSKNGFLYLTENQIIFEANSVLQKPYTLTIEKDNINICSEWKSTGLIFNCKDGSTHSFVVNSVNIWLNNLEKWVE